MCDAVATQGIHFLRGNQHITLPSEGQTDTHFPVLEEALFKSPGSKHLLINSWTVSSMVLAEHSRRQVVHMYQNITEQQNDNAQGARKCLVIT